MSGKSDYKNKYASENYDSLRIIVPKGGKEIIKKAVEKSEINSINGYVTTAINEKLLKDGFEPISKKTEEQKDDGTINNLN